MSKINVVLEGRGPLTLTDNSYIAKGGEGTVYKAGNTIVKILTDAAKAQELLGKIKAFVQLKHPSIAAPEGIVTNAKGAPLGLYGPFVDGTALSLVFTNDWRTKHQFDDGAASTLVNEMREVFRFAHDHNAIMIDPNELNWIVAKDLEPTAIDVDAWYLGGPVPATVPKMPSIHDWHSKNVSRESDWFAFGVITFQVFSGLHPYKGTLPGYKMSELERRMKDNKSVFTPGVKLNLAVRDFSCIPGKLMDWYMDIFQTGNRSIPPSPFDKTTSTPKSIAIARVVVSATGKLKFERLGKLRDVTRIFTCGAVMTKDRRIYAEGDKLLCEVQSEDCELLRVEDGWLLYDGKFSLITDHAESLPIHISGKVVVASDRMFIANERGLTELVLRRMGRSILSTGKTWGCLYNSTQWFDEVGVQDALGAMFLIVPFGPNSVGQIRVKELDRMKVLNAKAGNRFVCTMSVNAAGEYVKNEFTFTEDYSSYSVWTGTAASPELNIAILPKGVCAAVVEDGELVVFVPRNGSINKISDKDITTTMSLSRWGDRVLYMSQHSEVWRISM